MRRWDDGNDFADELLHRELAHSFLSSLDKKLLMELFYGTIRWRAFLDWVIDGRCSDKPPTGELANLLRLGVYQVLLLDRIPDYAAVDQTVGLASGGRRKFANAVLRRVAREKAHIREAWEKLKTDDPAIAFSHPRFLVERWRQQFGDDQTIALLKWNNEPPPLIARVNELKTNRDALQSELRAAGVVTRACAVHPLCMEIEPSSSLDELASFREGRFYVQDPSTLQAVDLLDPRPGETIWDVCAAPGGKTTYIAQKMRNQGRIVATDASERRLRVVTENSGRLGVTIITPHSSRSTFRGPFDRILVDAPCSNTGVLRRRVDLRWRIQKSEIARLAAKQLGILGEAAPALKSGGRLVYSTCSLEPEENERVANAFLREHVEFQREESIASLPPESNVDGSYAVLFSKR